MFLLITSLGGVDNVLINKNLINGAVNYVLMLNVCIHEKKGLKDFSLDKLKSVTSLKKKKSKVWVYAKDPTKEELSKLAQKFNIHPTTIEDISGHNTRIKYEDFDNYTFLVLKGIESINDDRVNMYPIYIIDGNNFIITIAYSETKILDDLWQNKKKVESLLKKGEDYLLHNIVDQEVDKYLNIIRQISDEVKAIEEDILSTPGTKILDKLFRKHLMALDLKQRVILLMEVCGRLLKPSDSFIQKSLLPYIRDVYDHIVRVDNTLSYLLERIDGVRDSYMSLTSSKMNKTMQLLTVIMTLFIPLTFITGFYGMNIVLPAQDYIYMYWALIILMLLIVIVMLFVFEKRGLVGKGN